MFSYVQVLEKSLFSVSKVTKYYQCSFEFDCDGVRMTDEETKKLLTLGSSRDGLYLLEDSSIQVSYSSKQHSASHEV